MTSSPMLKVRRSRAVAVQPARATPIEVKSLSDWDNQSILRHPVSAILFYKHSSAAADKDPAETIKRALAEALVYYYPWAGRLKDGPDGKLVVDCTAEGVVFVEADVDFNLEQFGENSIPPPCPCIDELFYNRNSASIDVMPTLGSPLFTMQVTRFLCGGFVVSFTFDHVISDVFGASLFLTAISELARGARTPSVLPVWQREEILNARDPPRAPPSATLDIFHKPALGQTSSSQQEHQLQQGSSTYRSFFFGAREVAAIRSRVPEQYRSSSTSFELIVACVVYCRVTTLQHTHPDEQVRVVFAVNCRNKFVDNPIPVGYYGNASFPATFVCPMEELRDLGCALEKVRKAKEAVNEDYARSLLDIDVIRRRSPAANFEHSCTTYVISDWSRVGFSTLDFGSWGKPVYAGAPSNGKFRRVMSYLNALTNEKGEEGRLLNLYMPKDFMDRFAITISGILGSS